MRLDDRSGHKLDRRLEQVSAAADGLDNRLSVAERAPNLDQRLHERVVGDGDVLPDRVDQLRLGNQPARVDHEVRKDVVSAGPEPDLLRSANEHLPVWVQREAAKPPNRFRSAFVRVLARFRAHFVTRRRLGTTTARARHLAGDRPRQLAFGRRQL